MEPTAVMYVKPMPAVTPLAVAPKLTLAPELVLQPVLLVVRQLIAVTLQVAATRDQYVVVPELLQLAMILKALSKVLVQLTQPQPSFPAQLYSRTPQIVYYLGLF